MFCRATRFKTSLQFLLLTYRQLYAALDACKAADYVIFVLSPDMEVDAWGELALRCLQSQGLPDAVTVTQVCEFCICGPYLGLTYILH